MNPYQPPHHDSGVPPYWRRFWRALRRAARYYRTESAKDGLRLHNHIIGAGCLLAIAWIVIGVFVFGVSALLMGLKNAFG